jgi:hypothetical protein
MKKVTVSYGEYLDRYTILKVKESKGLDVAAELKEYDLTDFDMVGYWERLLTELHFMLWSIEDEKRTSCERYTSDYSDLSTLTCQLNDIRHKIKKEIDLFYNSEFTEQKSHKI